MQATAPANMPSTVGTENLLYQTHCITSLLGLEEARRRGPLVSWEALMSADPTATFFQSPGWCMEWYRSYDDLFRPLVVIVTLGDVLVGMIPLAVERSTGRLTFASDHMSDYRDVVAIPEYRETVIVELLRIYSSGNFPNPFRLGPMQPESETLGVLLSSSGRSARVRTIVRSHPCWRWSFSESAAAKRPMSKESVRRHLSHYKRQGQIGLERIETDEAWDSIKQEFFDQHSLRQLYTKRPMTFNDPRRRAFYDALFRKAHSSVHVSALKVAERVLAVHYGYTWRDVLYWGAPAFDIREDRHSPGQVLLALLIQGAAVSGLRGVDMTIGTEEFKKRFSNSYVDLPTAEIYSRAWQYYVRRLRDAVVVLAKIAIARFWGPQAWEQAYTTVMDRGRRFNDLGVVAGSARLARRGARAIGERARELIFIATPGDVRENAPTLFANERCSFHKDRIVDLLKWEGHARETANEIRVTLRKAPESLRKGHALHTVLVNDRLVGWGWSYWPKEPTLLTETGTVLEFEPNSVSLHDFYIIPEYRGKRFLQVLLTQILSERFAEGATLAYIGCRESNVALRKAVEGAGFRLVIINEVVRLLGWKRWRQRQL